MKQILVAILFMTTPSLGACDVKVRSQTPSHTTEFSVATSDYTELMAAFDMIAEGFGLKRVGAAPGLNELHGREVLFWTYEVQDRTERRGALTVTDVKAPGTVLLRVYEDGFSDSEQRTRFVHEVSEVVRRFGGTLLRSDNERSR